MAGSLISMRQQLLGWFLLVGLLPLVFLAVGLQWHLEQSLVSEKQSQLYVMAREKGRLLNERILAVKKQVEQAATLPSITRLLVNATDSNQTHIVAEFSRRFMDLNGHYDMLLVNAAGKVIFTQMNESDMGADLTSAIWRDTPSGIAFEQVKALMTTIITPYRWYEPSKRRASFVVTPVWDARGNCVGALIVQLNVHWLDSIVASQIGLSETGEVMLSQHNPNGKLVAAAPLRFNPSALQDEFLLDGHHNIPANRDIRGEEGWGEGVDYRDNTVLAGWVHIPALQMALVVKQDKKEILAPLLAQRWLILLTLLLLLGFIAGVMLLVIRHFVQPIQNVASVAAALAQGRWYMRIAENQQMSVEIYQLEHGLNQLAETIESQLDKLQQQATELEEQGSELKVYAHNLEDLVAERTQELERLSVVDPMTGLFNRRHYMNEAPKLWRQAARNQQILLFILLDVDKFKEYNDTQGHQAGDNALIRIAQVLQENCRRGSDLVFRMGGEEMAVLSLVQTEQEALILAEHILTAIQMCAIPHPASCVMPVLTASLGLSLFDGTVCNRPIEPDLDHLYGLADAALYQAKTTGRNRAVLANSKLNC